MLNENAKKWVEALRSGEFKQATKDLHNENGYCCLGVACALYQREVGDLAVRYDKHGVFGARWVYDGAGSGLPDKVLHWLRLNNSLGQLPGLGDDRALYRMNDSGKRFSEIADFIESEPPGLFVT